MAGCSLRRPVPLSLMDEPRLPLGTDSTNPAPHERVQRLRLGVRVVWWSAVLLTLCFGGLALWMGVVQRDPFGLAFAMLAACCAVAGYGALVALRRRPVS